MIGLLALAGVAGARQYRIVRFGYFAEPQPFQVACAQGWFDVNDTTTSTGAVVDIEVVCLPQTSGGLAVAKLDRGDLDVAVLGSTPWAQAVSRGGAPGDDRCIVTCTTSTAK